MLMERPTAAFAGLPDIPAMRELAGLTQWVCWTYREVNGRWTKPPISPVTGRTASVSNPADWVTLDQAAAWAASHPGHGVGIVLTADDGLTGIDLDKVFGEDGALEPWAEAIVGLRETYAEISPSGRGIRMIARGKVERPMKADAASVEVYGAGRYLTITGQHLDGTPIEILPAPRTLETLASRVRATRAEQAEESAAAPAQSLFAQWLNTPDRPAGEVDFWGRVNECALENLDAWVRVVFPKATFHPGTGAWRVTSKDLGRQYQEDLSIHPSGIWDYGPERAYTPTYLVAEWTGRQPLDAALWLCERIGVHPAALGYKAPRQDAPVDWRPPMAAPAGEAPAASRFRLETVSDLRLLPPQRWLVKGWVPAGATGVLYGKWGAGKSFVAFDLALHLAYGMPTWWGADLPAGGGRVLVIAREGHAGFVGRVDAFRRKHGLVDDTDRLVFMRAAISFMEAEDFKGLLEALQGQRFDLVLVDTVARVMPGSDMNEGKVVTAFMERCAALGEAVGGSAIGVHHQNKSGSMMGSVYFEANADFVFEVTRDGDENGGEDGRDLGPLKSGVIRCTKQKDGEDGWKKTITYERVALGIEESSLVVGSILGEEDKVKVSAEDQAFRDGILNFVRRHYEAGRVYDIGRPGKPDLVRALLTDGFVKTAGKERVRRLVGDLIQAGVLVKARRRVRDERVYGVFIDGTGEGS